MGGIADLLLLHELGVGAVVDDILSEDGGSEDGVNVLGADVLELAIENEVVSGGAHSNGGLLAEEDEGENVTKLEGIPLAIATNRPEPFAAYCYHIAVRAVQWVRKKCIGD